MSEETGLSIAGLRITVHGREFPDATDYDDADWLFATAICEAPGACVKVTGSFLAAADIADFSDGCSQMLETLAGSASLEPLEPNLSVRLTFTDDVGHIEAVVEITPDNVLQSHRFTFALDQSYLPHILSECANLLTSYPVRGR